jgi:hypothetical protein
LRSLELQLTSAARVSSTASSDRIDETDREILQALREQHAVDEQRRKSSHEIDKLVFGKSSLSASGALKQRLRKLVRLGYLDVNSTTGKRGGYWIRRAN